MHFRPHLCCLFVIHWSCALWPLAPAPLFGALFGEVERLDGKSFDGEIRFEPGAFLVIGEAGLTNRIALDQLLSLSCQFVSDEALRAREGGRGLEGTYFGKMDLSGKKVSRIDPQVDFQWGDDSPADGIPRDHFSARWEGEVQAPASGKFRFYIVTDDGGRLWVNDRLLVDQWRDQSPTEGSGEMDVEKDRRYPIKFEFYERTSGAMAKLFWSGPSLDKEIIRNQHLFHKKSSVPSAESGGLIGAYFKGKAFNGSARYRIDQKIDFDWKDGSPMEGIPRDHFCIRWEGRLKVLESRPYTFHVSADDGVRLWVNGERMIDQWSDGVFQLKSKAIELESGQEYDLRLEHYENAGQARARLAWSAPSFKETIIPPQNLVPTRLNERRPSVVSKPVKPPRRQEEKPELSAGVMLTEGSIVARSAHAADETALHFSTSPREPVLSTVNVARVFLDRIPGELVSSLEPGRRGLLLRNRDFIDGEFRRLEGNRVRIDSVLFGVRDFERHKVWAILLRDPREVPAEFEVATRNGSFFRVNGFDVEKERLLFAGSPLEPFAIEAEDLIEIVRKGAIER